MNCRSCVTLSTVCQTVSKACTSLLIFNVLLIFIHQLRCLAFAIIWSTTIALPAWHRYCWELKLKPGMFPRDVITRWNSTYIMLSFAIKYCTAIDAMTADKSVKLRRFELDDDEWGIVEDLVAVLHVRTCHILSSNTLTLFHSNTRTWPSFSHRSRLALLL